MAKVGVFDASAEGQPEFDIACDCGWHSTGWGDVEHAKARAQQHADEHKTGEPAPELAEFREQQGIDDSPRLSAGAVHVIDSEPGDDASDGEQA